MGLILQTTCGESKLWRPAESYASNAVLVMKDTGRIFLRTGCLLVRLDDAKASHYTLPELGGLLFREVKAILNVEL